MNRLKDMGDKNRSELISGDIQHVTDDLFPASNDCLVCALN